MAAIDARAINIPERQRKQFKDSDLQDLADSIQRVGLIHAPVVEANTFNLIAGERRLRAIELIEGEYKYGDETFMWPRTPAHLVTSDDPKLLFEIELEENLRRVNLTPMEEAAAIAKLHQVRQVVNPQQTMKETAKELGELTGKPANAADEAKVSDALIIEQFKDDPEVQKASKVSMKKAAKVAKKKLEIELLRALSGGEEETTSGLFEVIPGNALDILPTLEPNSFDILLFDPPYGVGADKFGEQAMDLGHQYEDTADYALKFLDEVLKSSETFLKSDAHVLMFCAFEHFDNWKTIYENYNFQVWPRPLIWSKGQQSHVPVPDYGPRYSYECILFASRGKRKINTLINDVIHTAGVRDKIHAAEKPVELLATLIDFVAMPGNKIIDPCVGSGNLFLAGRNREVKITGIELDPNYYLVAKERAKEASK